jgi:DNA-binding transcriptional LysR family regulator
MRLRHIEVFHAIQQTGSISRAAEFLGVSQPAASKVLRHAEASLGFKLFDRVKGRLQPTVEAQILFLETDKIYRGIENLRQLAQNLRKRPEGHLRIGCLPSLGLSMMPKAVQAFRKTHPGVTCQSKTDHEEGLIDAILARDLDLALTFDAVETPGITNEVIGRAELVHVGLDSTDGELDLQDVQQNAYIGIVHDDVIGRLLNDALQAIGREIAPLITVQTYYVACALAEAGCGSAIVDEFTARAMTRGDLKLRRLKQRIEFKVIALSHHAGSNREFCRSFLKILKMTSDKITSE